MMVQVPTDDGPVGGEGGASPTTYTGMDVPNDAAGVDGDTYYRYPTGGAVGTIFRSSGSEGNGVAPETQYITITTGLGGEFKIEENTPGITRASDWISALVSDPADVQAAIEDAPNPWLAVPSVSISTYPNGNRQIRLEWAPADGNRPLVDLSGGERLIYGRDDHTPQETYVKQGGTWSLISSYLTMPDVRVEIDNIFQERGIGDPDRIIRYQTAPQTIPDYNPPAFTSVEFGLPVDISGAWGYNPQSVAVQSDALFEIGAVVTLAPSAVGQLYSIRLMVGGAQIFKRTVTDNTANQIPIADPLEVVLVIPPMKVVVPQANSVYVEISSNDGAPMDTVPGMQTHMSIVKIADVVPVYP